MKIPIRAAQNKQRGRMRPAGRQFDMPDLDLRMALFLRAGRALVKLFRGPVKMTGYGPWAAVCPPRSVFINEIETEDTCIIYQNILYDK